MHTSAGHPRVDAQAEDVVRRVDPDQLDPEAPERVERDVEGEETGRSGVKPSLDDVHEQCCREEVPERLVEEGRMVGALIERHERPVRRVDLEPPGKVGGLAVELLVPPVADSPHRLGDEQARCETVGEEPHVGPGALRDDPADETSCGDPAPDSEATLPDRERPPPLIRAPRSSSSRRGRAARRRFPRPHPRRHSGR